ALDSPTHALDVVSTIEATLEDPRQVLRAQEKAARGEAVARMKAEGIDYDERMALLEEVTYPRPLAELLEPAFAMYTKTNPWVADAELSPKSVVRDMVEHAMTFTDLISRYGLERSEGVALRYLADAYRAMRQVVPDEHRTGEVEEVVEWLGELVRGVDSSLLDEWERLANPDPEVIGGERAFSASNDDAPLRPVTGNVPAFRRLVRNAMFRLVELAAREDYAGLAALSGDPAWDADAWADALDPLFAEQGDYAIGIDAKARSAALLTILEPGADLPPSALIEPPSAVEPETTAAGKVPPDTWWVRQTLDDYDGNHDWNITARIDLPASDDIGAVALTVLTVGLNRSEFFQRAGAAYAEQLERQSVVEAINDAVAYAGSPAAEVSRASARALIDAGGWEW
ncbi:MAG: DUF3516 domain-containing protein, partial [Promicromonosporaceae bacterium]|nr:DUF3516 domain-containing protein [Promicromonosporaceae bacterium]